MDERVRTEIDAGIAHVRMNRPAQRNGLDVAMFDGLIGAGLALAARGDVRAIVLSGEGPAFCAGLDFRSIMANPSAMKHLLGKSDASPANVAQRVGWVWREVPVPVIAAIQGPCFGGGLQIALGADVRYAAPDARLSVMEIEWGLIPDMGASRTLLPLVRPDIAKELTFSGRIVNANEAAELGLVTRVVDDPLAAALDAARNIAKRSPHAIRAAKALYDRASDLNEADALALETELQLTLLGSANQLEAVQSRMMKRPASFKDVADS